MTSRTAMFVFGLVALASVVACGGDNAASNPGSGGSAGSAGAAGASGAAGTAGSAGATSATCTWSPTPVGDKNFDGLVDDIATSAKLFQVPGGMLAVYADGQLHTAVFGSKSAAKCDPVTPSTRFNGTRLADVITTLAAVRLAAKGKIDLDAPARTYLTDLKLEAASEKWAPELTLRNLLSFSSGYFPVYWWPEDPGACPSSIDAVGGQSGPDTLAKFFAGAAEPIYHEPGTQWMYGSPGFALVGRAMEVADGMPFADVIRTEVAERSGLDLTYDPDVYENGNLAEPKSAASTCGLFAPNRGLFLDAQDLGKLVKAFASGGDDVVSKSEVDALFNGGVVEAVPGVGASGLAFFRLPLPPVGTRAARGGEDGQYRSGVMIIVPEQHFGYAWVANKRSPLLRSSESAVFGRYFPTVGKYEHATDPATWNEYAGRYQRDDGVGLTVSVDNGNMTFDIDGDPSHVATPAGIESYLKTGGLAGSTDPDYFQLDLSTFEAGNIVRFYRDNTGKPVAVGFIRGDGLDKSRPFYRVQ